MREPIKHEDIRIGDTVEVTHSGITCRLTVAERLESRLVTDQGGTHEKSRGDWYLLDRPTPAVDLPERPTLGWLTSRYGGSVVGTWERYESTVRSRAREVSALVRERDLPLEDVAAFVEATAVPKAALDELRDYLLDSGLDLTGAVEGFLAAVDAANGGDDR